MRIVKTWRGKPDIMDEDIKWDQRFGNMFGGFLGMSFIFVVIVFFYEGCSYQRDSVVVEEEEETKDETFNPSDWILYKR